MKGILINLMLYMISFSTPAVVRSQEANSDSIITATVELSEILEKSVITGAGTISYNWDVVDTTSTIWEEMELFKKNNPNKLVSVTHKCDTMYMAFNGPKRLFHETIKSSAISGLQERMRAYNGEKWDIIESKSTPDGKRTELAKIMNGNEFEMHEFDPVYAMSIYGTSISNFFKGEPINRKTTFCENIKYNSMETLYGSTCLVFSCSVQNEGILTAWISKDSYLPVKIEINYPTLRTVKILSTKKHPSGEWFLKKMTLNQYQKEKITNNWILTTVSELTVHDDFKVNCAVPDSLFELHFPVGVDVLDSRSGIYINR